MNSERHVKQKFYWKTSSTSSFLSYKVLKFKNEFVVFISWHLAFKEVLESINIFSFIDDMMILFLSNFNSMYLITEEVKDKLFDGNWENKSIPAWFELKNQMMNDVVDFLLFSNDFDEKFNKVWYSKFWTPGFGGVKRYSAKAEKQWLHRGCGSYRCVHFGIITVALWKAVSAIPFNKEAAGACISIIDFTWFRTRMPQL